MTQRITIYMPLTDEGTECWRPVEAEPHEGAYRVLGEVPETEIWRFPPGSLVICQPKDFSDGARGLVAVALSS